MTDSEQLELIDEKYVEKRYKSQIDYYWAASSTNKKAYKRYRSWTIFLGALVTLVSSLSAAEFIQSVAWIRITFAILTPVIAALLTVINGLGQNFHWGATWRDMAMNATQLEKERDRFLATRAEKRNLETELDVLNTIVFQETRNFFQRVLDSEVRPREQSEASG